MGRGSLGKHSQEEDVGGLFIIIFIFPPLQSREKLWLWGWRRTSEGAELCVPAGCRVLWAPGWGSVPPQGHPQPYLSLPGSSAEPSLRAPAQSQFLLLAQAQNPANPSSPFCGFESICHNHEQREENSHRRFTKSLISLHHLWGPLFPSCVHALHADNQRSFPRSCTSANSWRQLWGRWTLADFGHNLQAATKTTK